MAIDRNMLEKLSPLMRTLCAIICLASIAAAVSAVAFGLRESVAFVSIALIVASVFLYVCAPIVVSGYPPKLLLWTMDRKKE